ncbi:MAG: hypothetical protein AAB649_01085, partial [Patescibacteria group bacterium]
KSVQLRLQMLESVLSNPDFQSRVVRSEKDAKNKWGEGNYAKTTLPQLRGRYMPKPLAWAFDDMVRTGFQWENPIVQSVERFAQNTMKPFYFTGPEVHVFNELDKFIVGHGDKILNPIMLLNPNSWTGAAKRAGQALIAVRNQDGIMAEIMGAGGNPMFLHSKVAHFSRNLGRITGVDMSLHPWKYDPIMKVFGTNTRDTLSRGYQSSNKLMWWQTDFLYTYMYLEGRAKELNGRKMHELPQGEQDRIARNTVVKVEKIIDSYLMPSTIGHSVGLRGTEVGRLLQKVSVTPLLSLFGRYTYGLYKTFAHITKNIAGPSSTLAQRATGAGQAAMLVALYNIGYPLISKGWSTVTGDEKSEFETRGVTRFATEPLKV